MRGRIEERNIKRLSHDGPDSRSAHAESEGTVAALGYSGFGFEDRVRHTEPKFGETIDGREIKKKGHQQLQVQPADQNRYPTPTTND